MLRKAESLREMMPKILKLVPFTREFAEEKASWRYEPPYDVYNEVRDGKSADPERYLLPHLNYFAVLDEKGEMIAFRCFGLDAQVPGGDYSIPALGIGGGLRPDLTGKGLGRHLIAAAINFGIAQYRPQRFRVTVARFNERARKTCVKLGFERSSAFTATRLQRDFDILVRKAGRQLLEIPLGKARSQTPANRSRICVRHRPNVRGSSEASVSLKVI